MFLSCRSLISRKERTPRARFVIQPSREGMVGTRTVLLAQDSIRNLAATLELDEHTTNAQLRLEPALDVLGQSNGPPGDCDYQCQRAAGLPCRLHDGSAWPRNPIRFGRTAGVQGTTPRLPLRYPRVSPRIWTRPNPSGRTRGRTVSGGLRPRTIARRGSDPAGASPRRSGAASPRRPRLLPWGVGTRNEPRNGPERAVHVSRLESGTRAPCGARLPRRARHG